jgi:two-component system response regulator DegU
MDVQMPGMDGVQATWLISERYPDVRIIALSSFGETATVMEMITAGARGYLPKNTSKEELHLAIGEVTLGRIYISPKLHVDNKPSETASVAREAIIFSTREEEVIQLICDGKTSKEIAQTLWLSKRTVDGHRERILQKTGCRNLAELMRFTWRHHGFRS